MSEKKGIRVSNTAIDKYESCGKAYKLRYIDKLVSKTKGSALCFGVAMDAGLDHLLQNPTDLKGAIFRFDRKWLKQNDNMYKPMFLNKTSFVTYSKSDINEEILLPSDYKRSEERNEPLAWYSLRRKGHHMLKAYKEQILPSIKRVISTQQKVTLTNSETGDEIVGIIDILAELHDGRIALLDNKTSSVKYKDDSVKESSQLAMYKWILEENTDHDIQALGYLVINKKFLKNAVVKTQIVIDSVNEEKIEEIIDKINRVVLKIKNEEFEMNLSSCKTYFGLCDYYNYCHNGTTNDLIDMRKENGQKA